MSYKRKAYTINWTLLVQKYNENNIGQISQSRLAEVFGESRTVISLDQTIPRSLKNLEAKYLKTYIKQFESLIPFKNILIEHEVIDKKI